MSDEGSCSPEPKNSQKEKGKEIIPGDPHYNQPGHISTLFGVIVGQHGKKKQDNSLSGMYGPLLYVSPFTNTVFARTLAEDASVQEVKHDETYFVHTPLYELAPQGFPMNPAQADTLYSMMRNVSYRSDACSQAYDLLVVFQQIASFTRPQDRDRTMTYILKIDHFDLSNPPSHVLPHVFPLIEQPSSPFRYNP
ncbi:hypothetical protein BDQ17DRAFT_1427766 [Cyathus striatus]|nr:hypothetical protein BDQ17DRAFT_1427766 [Cyathus striatus]